MTPAEQHFLDHYAPYDWRSTRAELAARHGITRYHDWMDVITLPPGLCGLTFHAYAEPPELPPEYLFADYHAHADARANHAALASRLTALLGAGTDTSVSNTVALTWTFGVFQVCLTAYPPDLQSRAQSNNALYAKAPHLAESAKVTITSEYAWVFPDESLAGVAAGAVPVSGRVSWGRANTRRNPDTLAVTGLVAWRDGERVGFSEERTSLVLDRRGPLVLVDVAQGRAPASTYLELAGKLVLHGGGADFPATAARIAAVWGLPLAKRQEPGDY